MDSSTEDKILTEYFDRIDSQEISAVSEFILKCKDKENVLKGMMNRLVSSDSPERLVRLIDEVFIKEKENKQKEYLELFLKKSTQEKSFVCLFREKVLCCTKEIGLILEIIKKWKELDSNEALDLLVKEIEMKLDQINRLKREERKKQKELRANDWLCLVDEEKECEMVYLISEELVDQEETEIQRISFEWRKRKKEMIGKIEDQVLVFELDCLVIDHRLLLKNHQIRQDINFLEQTIQFVSKRCFFHGQLQRIDCTDTRSLASFDDGLSLRGYDFHNDFVSKELRTPNPDLNTKQFFRQMSYRLRHIEKTFEFTSVGSKERMISECVSRIDRHTKNSYRKAHEILSFLKKTRQTVFFITKRSLTTTLAQLVVLGYERLIRPSQVYSENKQGDGLASLMRNYKNKIAVFGCSKELMTNADRLDINFVYVREKEKKSFFSEYLKRKS